VVGGPQDGVHKTPDCVPLEWRVAVVILLVLVLILILVLVLVLTIVNPTPLPSAHTE
jgi:hypothetical protein